MSLQLVPGEPLVCGLAIRAELHQPGWSELADTRSKEMQRTAVFMLELAPAGVQANA